MDVLLDWIEAQAPGREFTSLDATAETGVPDSSVRTYLGPIVKQGTFGLTRVEGTGKPGIPSRYVRAVPEPEVAPGEPPAPDAAPASAVPVADREVVLGALRIHGRPMSESLLLARVGGLKVTALRATPADLLADGLARRDGHQWRAA
ncbi:hypothetical protein [Deinococcus apachensis]|uniref:hypothetical protein n=1 Tax=Deinococcus apachensis TaxID=309886 RepID=UPI0003681E6D|nr:hypothetical protein [Deinococcus apachensis]